ncbi:MAG: S41 family peptidase [Bacteroides sp.]|nr:S41 family peptidase [Eubacterium sp.]MCM1418555.1 S41 family peptidase [Roseburia sp.]MCM1462610.1 S41 family peptidase [Bacteroides sp.]
MVKHKFFWTLYLFTTLVAAVWIGLIGSFVAPLPLWAARVAALLPTAVVIAEAVVTRSFSARASLKLAGALLAAGICYLFSFCNPYFGSANTALSPKTTLSAETALSPGRAVVDLEEIEALLNRLHPAFLDGEPETFRAAMDEAKAELSRQNTVTVNELRRAAMTAVSTLSDAHTTIYALGGDDRYRADYAEMRKAGYEIAAVNGVPYAEFFREHSRLVSYEAESWADYQLVDGYLISVSGLTYLDIATDGFTLTYTNGAEETTKSYTDADFLPYDEYMAKNAAYYEDSSSFVSYTIDEEKSLAILTLEECIFNDEYTRTLREMFTEVKAKGIENVAVDLRGNSGGQSWVANEFIRYLDVDSWRDGGMKWRLGGFLLDFPPSETENERIADLTFKGDVYILTSASSFSSAMLYALYFKDNSLGTIVGEPPGNAPNGYGEIVTFRLPGSGLFLQCSTKRFTRPDTAAEGLLIEPDVPCLAEEAEKTLFRLIGGEEG